MDISLDEMKEMFRVLGEDKLQNTTGDKEIRQKLEDMRKILEKIQLNTQNDPRISSQLIGKAVADAIAIKLANMGGISGKTDIENLVNADIIASRKSLIQELDQLSTATKAARNSIGGMGGGGYVGGSGGGSPFGGGNTGGSNRQNPFERPRQTTGQLMAVGIAEVSKTILSGGQAAVKEIDNTVDQYRKMQALGQTFDNLGKNSLTSMRMTAESANMTTDVFLKALSNSGAGLRQLGANSFAGLVKGLDASSRDLGYFGLNIDDTNTALSDYVEGQKYTVGLDKINQANVNAGFKELIVNTTGLAAAFGISREQLIKDSAKNAEDITQQALTAGMNKQQKDGINEIFAALGNDKHSLTALKLSQGVIQVGGAAGYDAVANQRGFQAEQQAYANYDKNGGNMQLLRTQLEQVGKIGLAQLQEQDPTGVQRKLALSDPSNPANAALLESYNHYMKLSNINNKAANAAEDKITQPDAATVEAQKKERSDMASYVAAQALATTVMNTWAQSGTALLKNYNDFAQKLPEVTATIARYATTLESLDTALAAKITQVGPTGQAIATTALKTIADIGNSVGGIYYSWKIISGTSSWIAKLAQSVRVGAVAVEAGTGTAALAGSAAGATGLAAAAAPLAVAAAGAAIGGAGVYLTYRENMKAEDREKAANQAGYKTDSTFTNDETGLISNTFARNGKTFSETDINAILKKLSDSQQPVTPDLVSKAEDQYLQQKEMTAKIIAQMGFFERQFYEMKSVDSKAKALSEAAKLYNLPDPTKLQLTPDTIPVAPPPANDNPPPPAVEQNAAPPVTPTIVTPSTSNGETPPPTGTPNTTLNQRNKPQAKSEQEQAKEAEADALSANLKLSESINRQSQIMLASTAAQEEHNMAMRDLLKQIQDNTGDTSRNVMRNPNRVT